MSKDLLHLIELTARRIEKIEAKEQDNRISLYDRLQLEYYNHNLKYLHALEILKGCFNFKFSVTTGLNGDVLGRIVSIEVKNYVYDWDYIASVNLVDFKEEFDFLKEVLSDEIISKQ